MSPKKVQPDTPSSDNKGVITLSNPTSSTKTSKSEKSSKSAGSESPENKSSVGKVLGGLFVIVGLALVGLLIIIFVISRLPYRKDSSLPIPTLEKLDEETREDEVDIKGETIPGETVMLFKDGEMLDQKEKADNDGNFEFEKVELDEEGDTDFEAVTVRGSVFKKRSEKSNKVTMDVDWTAPSSKVSLDYDEESTGDKATVKGKAEKNSYVILENEDNEYETKTDKDGNFEFKDVQLSKGENTYDVSVRDEAGNEVLSSSEVKITYEAGDINGNGATDSKEDTGKSEQLPESAGSLEEALTEILGNRLMFILGMLVVLAFSASGTAAYIYSIRQKK
ncbi:hypothetical protein JW710_01840 [Candidatus Dojkabacteria bacterium]|nr:hypothetical protein [Candidatus Dojkabacteria bacterium]